MTIVDTCHASDPCRSPTVRSKRTSAIASLTHPQIGSISRGLNRCHYRASADRRYMYAVQRPPGELYGTWLTNSMRAGGNVNGLDTVTKRVPGVTTHCNFCTTRSMCVSSNSAQFIRIALAAFQSQSNKFVQCNETRRCTFGASFAAAATAVSWLYVQGSMPQAAHAGNIKAKANTVRAMPLPSSRKRSPGCTLSAATSPANAANELSPATSILIGTTPE